MYFVLQLALAATLERVIANISPNTHVLKGWAASVRVPGDAKAG